MMKYNSVYLCGGMKTGWQDYVIQECPGATYIDPRSSGLDEEYSYTMWDLEGIDNCDVVFAFMEETNPSGLGLNLELGYAYAREKIIILVDSRSQMDAQFRRYMGMARSIATYQPDNLYNGVQRLKKLIAESNVGWK